MNLLAALFHVGSFLGGAQAQDAPAEIPSACAALEDSGATEALGPAVAFKPATGVDTTVLRLDQCRASAPEGAPAVSLLVRQIDAPRMRGVFEQMERYIDADGRGEVHERLDLGDGALWFQDLSQLAVWHRDGATVFVLTVVGEDPRALAEQAARALLKTYP